MMNDEAKHETLQAEDIANKKLKPSLSPDAFTYTWNAWNLTMGADNIIANAVEVMREQGVTGISGNGRSRTGEGSDGQRVRFFAARVCSSTKSICNLVVADTSDSHVNDLGGEIIEKLKPKIGL